VGRILAPQTVPPQQAPRTDNAPKPLPPLRVQTLGGFAVWRGSEPLPSNRWHRRKVAALFKALLGAPGHRLTRDQAAELLWPDNDALQSAAHLRMTLSRLRRALGLPAATANGPSYLRCENDMIILDPAPEGVPGPDWCDALAFAAAAKRALTCQDVAACSAALALYRGPYLPEDLYEDWTVGRRERLEHIHRAILLHRARVLSTQGAVPVLQVAAWEAVLEADQCQEEAARALLQLHAAAGQRAAGKRVYSALVRALQEELGESAAPETVALVQALWGRSAATSTVRTALPMVTVGISDKPDRRRRSQDDLLPARRSGCMGMGPLQRGQLALP
jgi:DNA-binding SARP family transcriptional activator